MFVFCVCNLLNSVMMLTHTHTLLWLDGHEYARIGIGPLARTDRKTNDAMCWNRLKTPVSCLPGSVYVHGHMVWKWERGCKYVRGVCAHMKEWETDSMWQVERQCVRYVLCIWQCVHAHSCASMKSHRTSFHSAGGHLHPPELQWAPSAAKCFHQQQQSLV